MSRSSRRLWLFAGLGTASAVLVAILAVVIALTGAGFGCLDGSSPSTAASPTDAARSDIPAGRLRIYQAAGRRFDIDWTVLASIGAQECGHGSCAGDNGSGCAGPMQIAVRRRSPCSPGDGPTLWDRYRVDAHSTGHPSADDPADAIYTAARILRQAKHAPATGGSYAAYRHAACAYYGACADAAANYADEVMTRAVQYGFQGPGAPAPNHIDEAALAVQTSKSCEGTQPATAVAGGLGQTHRATSPRRLAALPTSATGGALIKCDARIIADVEDLARRYDVRVSACYGIHTLDGEHPLGAATDLVPADGDWHHTDQLARAAGWSPACAASGVAPACAKPPFRFIGYDGYPGHGDPAHCVPCPGGAHLHLSWLTSASPGEPQSQSRTTYFAANWIDVFSTTATPDDGAVSPALTPALSPAQSPHNRASAPRKPQGRKAAQSPDPTGAPGRRGVADNLRHGQPSS